MNILRFGMVMVMAVVAGVWNSPKTASEKPAFFVGTGDKLMIVGLKPGVYKILSTRGDIGWIDKVSVRELRPGETMTFGEADVLGYLDNPTPIYILDPNDPIHNPILLERSFAQELKQNVDRMTIDRIVSENPPSL